LRTCPRGNEPGAAAASLPSLPPLPPPSVTAEAVYRGTDGAQRALHVSGLRTPLGVCACPCGLVPVARLRAWEGGGGVGRGGGRRRWSPRFGGRASVGTPVFTRHVPRRGPPHVLPSRRRHPPPTLSRSLRSVRVPLGVCSGGVKGGGAYPPALIGTTWLQKVERGKSVKAVHYRGPQIPPKFPHRGTQRCGGGACPRRPLCGVPDAPAAGGSLPDVTNP